MRISVWGPSQRSSWHSSRPGRVVPPGGVPFGPILTLLAYLAAAPGCAVHKQVQYFAATDPETGLTNYYKMTVTGSGGASSAPSIPSSRTIFVCAAT